MHVEVRGIGAELGTAAVDRTVGGAAVQHERAGDDFDFAALRQRHPRDLARGNVAIAGRLHFFLRWKIEPQLEPAHAALALLRHLGVDDAARRRHPLHVAGAEIPAVAQMILVAHVAVEHVGDRFESAVRMRWEARDVIVRVIGVELIEHQERIHILAALAAEAAAQLDAGAVGSRL